MKSLLIVAPDDEARATLVRRLERDDYLVIPADDAGQAKECLTGLLPGAIVIDLSLAATRELIHHLSGDAILRLIPRLVFITPLDLEAPTLVAAAAFERPVSPDHLARALRALYPRGKWNVAPADAVQASRKHDRIKEAIDMVAATPPPAATAMPPAVLRLGARPPSDGPSERAIRVAYAYAIETIEERISNDTAPAQAAAASLPAVVQTDAETNRIAVSG